MHRNWNTSVFMNQAWKSNKNAGHFMITDPGQTWRSIFNSFLHESQEIYCGRCVFAWSQSDCGEW